jgi:hypothetical protein
VDQGQATSRTGRHAGRCRELELLGTPEVTERNPLSHRCNSLCGFEAERAMGIEPTGKGLPSNADGSASPRRQADALTGSLAALSLKEER